MIVTKITAENPQAVRGRDLSPMLRDSKGRRPAGFHSLAKGIEVSEVAEFRAKRKYQR